MGQEVIWLPEAADDLEAIVAYIARDSPTYAANFAARILSTTADLPRFPKLGRRVTQWNRASLRERIVGNYRVIYQILPDRILILAVIHGARRLPKDLRKRAR